MNPIIDGVAPIIGISIMIYVIAYLVGRVLNKPDIPAFINMELLSLIIFIILLVVLLYMLDFAVDITISNLNPDAKSEVCDKYRISVSRCHVAIAGYFLESVLRELTDYYIQLNAVLLTTNFVKQTYSVKAIQGDKFVKLNMNPFIFIPSLYIEPIIGLVQTMLQFAIAQFIVLWYITSPQFFIGFLTLGIVLRLFAVTKSAGGLIIALVIGLYYVFPMAYVLMDVHYRYSYPGTYGFDKINTYRVTDHLLSVFGIPFGDRLDAAINAILNVESKPIDPTDPDSVVSSLGAALSNMASIAKAVIKIATVLGAMLSIYTLSFLPPVAIGYTLVGDAVPDIMRSIINMPIILLNIYTEFFIIFAVLIYISLISTVAFVKTLSPILGGDVEIAGITRFI